MANNLEKKSSSINISTTTESESLRDSKDEAVPKSPSTVIKMGTEFQKEFSGKYYSGKVVGLPNKRSKWYKVKYEDNDSEELDRDELSELLTERSF